jgi:hypothetical protein
VVLLKTQAKFEVGPAFRDSGLFETSTVVCLSI